jgi:hypothetical protein
MKSITAGGRGSPPLRGNFWNMTAQRSDIQKGAGGHGGPPLRGGFVTESQFSSCPMAIQKSKTAQLPADTFFGNGSMNKGPRTPHPSAREGVAALPYAEVFVHRVGASSGARWPPDAGGTSTHAVPPFVQVWLPWAPWWRPEADTAWSQMRTPQ